MIIKANAYHGLSRKDSNEDVLITTDRFGVTIEFKPEGGRHTTLRLTYEQFSKIKEYVEPHMQSDMPNFSCLNKIAYGKMSENRIFIYEKLSHVFNYQGCFCLDAWTPTHIDDNATVYLVGTWLTDTESLIRDLILLWKYGHHSIVINIVEYIGHTIYIDICLQLSKLDGDHNGINDLEYFNRLMK